MPGFSYHTDIQNIDFSKIINKQIMKEISKSVELCGANVFGKLKHCFPGGGLSFVIGIMESHVAIHTWPEFRFATIDVVSCAAEGNAEEITNEILRILKEKSPHLTYNSQKILRLFPE